MLLLCVKNDTLIRSVELRHDTLCIKYNIHIFEKVIYRNSRPLFENRKQKSEVNSN